MDIERDLFQERHIGPSPEDQGAMLQALGYDSLDKFIDAVVPADIRLPGSLRIPEARSEQEALDALRQLATQNQVFRSYLGMGYHDCFTNPDRKSTRLNSSHPSSSYAACCLKEEKPPHAGTRP